MSTSAGPLQTVVAMRDSKAGETPPVPPAAAAAARPTAAMRSPFVPLLLGLTALLAVLAHQAWQLDTESRQLLAARDAGAPQLAAATQVRRTLDLLAADTQRLADAGNAPARALVDELRRRGITIQAAAGTPGTTTAPPAAATEATASRR